MEHQTCLVCNKKLGLLPLKCKCGNVVCKTHKWPNHSCDYDYCSKNKEILEKKNPVIEPSKLSSM